MKIKLYYLLYNYAIIILEISNIANNKQKNHFVIDFILK